MGGSQLLVGLEQTGILLVIHRIVRLFSGLECFGIFVGDDGTGLLSELKVLVLDDPRKRNVAFGVVDNRVSLKVGYLQQSRLEAETPVFQMSVPIVEKGIDTSRKQDPVSQGIPVRAILQVVARETHFDTVQQSRYQFVVSSDGNPLVGIVEIVVVEREAERQPADDECRPIFPIAFRYIP